MDSKKSYTHSISIGIVDKNRHKGLCYQEAQKYNISHARLPIGKYIEMASRKVLTINHGMDLSIQLFIFSCWYFG